MLMKSVFLLSLIVLSPALLLAQSDEEIAGAAASAGGCLACGGFFMFMGLAILALNIALLVFVYKDARNRGMDNAVVWLIVVLFFPLLGVIVYLLARTKGDLMICPHCGGKRMQVSAKCPHCGNA
jgi:uncharacterized membrane protein YhaH (DUF805 family)